MEFGKLIAQNIVNLVVAKSNQENLKIAKVRNMMTGFKNQKN